MNAINIAENINIGGVTVSPNKNTTYKVTLNGLYEKDEIVEIPFTWEEDELEELSERYFSEIIEAETELTVDKILDVEVIDPNKEGYYTELRVTRERFFCISASFNIGDKHDAPVVDEAYFERMLTEHNIDPEDVIAVETCNIEGRTKMRVGE